MTLETSSRRRLHTVVQGSYHVTSDPDTCLATVLGSCVAVCLFDLRVPVGGMNHFLLPFGPGDSDAKPLRYGVHAMELLVNGLLKSGANRSDLRAKVFGAARISQRLRDIGSSNAGFALEFLEAERIPCVAQSLGGNSARRVVFCPTTGEAKVLAVPRHDFKAEDEDPASVPMPPLGSNATLF